MMDPMSSCPIQKRYQEDPKRTSVCDAVSWPTPYHAEMEYSDHWRTSTRTIRPRTTLLSRDSDWASSPNSSF